MSLSRNPKEIFDHLIDRTITEDEQKVLETLQELESQNEGRLFNDVIRLLSRNKLSLLEIAAKNGKLLLINFITESLMKSEERQEILKFLLNNKNEEGRQIIHVLADINHKDITPCFEAIIKISQKLGMVNYINSKDEYYHSTPLMYAARRGSPENIKILFENKADIDAKANNGLTAFDLMKSADPKEAIPKLLCFLSLHEKSRLNFNRNNCNFLAQHPDAFDAKNEKHSLLKRLLEIDIDISLPHYRAQLSAFTQIVQSEKALQKPEEKLFISHRCRHINYALILKEDLEPKIQKLNELIEAKDKGPRKEKKEIQHEDKEINALLERLAHDIARSPLLIKEYDRISLIQSNFLLLLTNDPRSQMEAAVLFGMLIGCAPELALNGLRAVNKASLDEVNQFQVARRTLLALAQIEKTKLGPEEKSSRIQSFFHCHTKRHKL